MIPDLALMIWAYILFRMLEVFAFPESRYTTNGKRTVICIFAVLVILVASWSLLDIWITGSQTAPQIRQLLPH